MKDVKNVVEMRICYELPKRDLRMLFGCRKKKIVLFTPMEYFRTFRRVITPAVIPHVRMSDKYCTTAAVRVGSKGISYLMLILFFPHKWLHTEHISADRSPKIIFFCMVDEYITWDTEVVQR